MSVKSTFLELAKLRRSVYALGNHLPIAEKDVVHLIQKVVRTAPSSFNAQGSRVVVLFGVEHEKLWKDVVLGAIRKVTADDGAFKGSEQKVMGCFASGAGTVLFFEDQTAVEKMQKDYPSYAAAFPRFAQEASAMAQFSVWTALAEHKIGASLQHYNELIEADVHSTFDIDPTWKLMCQMPFGNITKTPDAKTFIPDEGRFIVKGK